MPGAKASESDLTSSGEKLFLGAFLPQGYMYHRFEACVFDRVLDQYSLIPLAGKV